MIKVVCIEQCENQAGNTPDCMPGVIYEIKPDVLNIFYDKIYENGKLKGFFDKHCFITLAEWREQQINSILND